MIPYASVRLFARSALAAIAITGLAAASAFSNERSERVARAVEKISLVKNNGTEKKEGSANLSELLEQARSVPAFKADPAAEDAFKRSSHKALREGKGEVPDQYLVVMRADHFPIQYTSSQSKGRRLLSADGILAEEFAEHMVNEVGGSLYKVFQNTRPTFAASLTEKQKAKLEKHPLIEYIAPNGIGRIEATWGLDRTDQRNLPLSNSYQPDKTGAGVHVYVLDTGIRATHQEFAGRLGAGNSTSYPSTNDGQGHGTHVAGSVAGSTYGIAPQATLHAVKVLNDNGGGSAVDVIDGIDWAIADHQARNATPNEIAPAVANMSLGFLGGNLPVDNAVEDLINAGVTLVAAAGNRFWTQDGSGNWI